jgi:hypothetical protein
MAVISCELGRLVERDWADELRIDGDNNSDAWLGSWEVRVMVGQFSAERSE